MVKSGVLQWNWSVVAGVSTVSQVLGGEHN